MATMSIPIAIANGFDEKTEADIATVGVLARFGLSWRHGLARHLFIARRLFIVRPSIAQGLYPNTGYRLLAPIIAGARKRFHNQMPPNPIIGEVTKPGK